MKYTQKIGRFDRRRIGKIGGFKMTRLEYRQEYLRSPQWKALRGKFLKTKDGKCERCGNPGNDVHHIAYKFKETEWEQMQALMLLCRACHNKIHAAVNLNILRIPHRKTDVTSLDDEKLDELLRNARKKDLVPMMLISNIVKNGTLHGIHLACGKLKITQKTFCSIPPNLKATKGQIEYLRWIEKTKPTRDGWKEKAFPTKSSRKRKSRRRKK